MSPQPWLIQSDPSTGVACTNISLEATQEWKALQIPWTWVGFPFPGGRFRGPYPTIGGHCWVPSGWCLKVGCYWILKWTFHPGVQSNSRDSRRENAAELMATLMSQEQVASRIYFLKFRRAHLWKYKINGHLSVSGWIAGVTISFFLPTQPVPCHSSKIFLPLFSFPRLSPELFTCPARIPPSQFVQCIWAETIYPDYLFALCLLAWEVQAGKKKNLSWVKLQEFLSWDFFPLPASCSWLPGFLSSRIAPF